LAELKIKSLEDFVAQGDTYARRRQLANSLRLGSDRVAQLVKIADLLRIPEIKPAHARLLANSEYDLLAKLINPDPGQSELNLDQRADQVRTALAAQNQPPNLIPDAELPTSNEIKVWLKRAQVLKIRLKL
jgi:hypothetical protein